MPSIRTWNEMQNNILKNQVYTFQNFVCKMSDILWPLAKSYGKIYAAYA